MSNATTNLGILATSLSYLIDKLLLLLNYIYFCVNAIIELQ